MVVELPAAGGDTVSKGIVRERREEVRLLGFGYHILMSSGNGNVVDDVSDRDIWFQSRTNLAMGWRRELRQLLARTVA